MQENPCRAAIELLAYILWDLRGRPEGDSEADWVRAERELITAVNAGNLDGYGQSFVNDTATAAQLRAFAVLNCQ
jgi:hypothetical protein